MSTEPETAPAGTTSVVPRGASSLFHAVLVGLVFVAVVGLVLGYRSYDRFVANRPEQTTDDAFLRADLTPLSARIEGYVRAVAVRDHEHVVGGQLLVEIDDTEYRSLVAEAEAAVLVDRAAIANLESKKRLQHAEIARARATASSADADRTRAEAEANRQKKLLTETFSTQQHVETATADQERTRASLAGARAGVEAETLQLDVLDTQIAQADAGRQRDEAALAIARTSLGYARIVAPGEGTVGEREVRPGQLVRVGTRLVSWIPSKGTWVTANFKETQLAHLRPGDTATIRVDAYPDLRFRGHVESLSPASGAAFSLLPADNATGNFTKVTQRVSVKIVFDDASLSAELLRPGLSVEATVATPAGDR